MTLKKWLLGIGGVMAIGVTLTALGTTGLWRSNEPDEVRVLKSIVVRLSKANDLGTRPIHFMVVSGSYASYLAEERGLCKEDKCTFFAQLNPYRAYGNGWNELMRQAYAFGDIQAWTVSTGTIAIPQATFRAYGDRTGYLACTVAHEIAHFKRDHIFKESYHNNYNLKGYSDEDKKLELNRFNRQQELEADRDAADMMTRAGYASRVCQEDISFMHRSTGDGSTTEDESTHPGYEERVKAMRVHYDAMTKKPLKPQRSTPGSFHYDAGENLLTFSPKQ